MRRKSKLIVSIIVMVLVLALMSLAIWASIADIGIGGDINFNAPDLEVTIEGKLYGHDRDHMSEENAEILPGVTWTANTAEDGVENNLDWSNLDLNFADKYTDVIIEIFMTNNHAEKAIVVSYVDNTDLEGKNFSVSIENSGTSTENIISVGETIKYTITLSILDRSKSVKDGKLDIIFSLSNAI